MNVVKKLGGGGVNYSSFQPPCKVYVMKWHEQVKTRFVPEYIEIHLLEEIEYLLGSIERWYDKIEVTRKNLFLLFHCYMSEFNLDFIYFNIYIFRPCWRPIL